jgi:hypothetical protein
MVDNPTHHGPSSGLTDEAYSMGVTERLEPYVGTLLITRRPGSSPSDVLYGATLSFVDTGKRRFAVTCAHVYDKYLELLGLSEPVELALFGTSGTRPLYISESKVIDTKAKDPDLVVLQLPDEDDVQKIGKEYFKADIWPPTRAKVGEAVAIVGFPGKRRGESKRGLEVRTDTLLLTVSSVSDFNFALANDGPERKAIKLCSDASNDVVYGGFSGGSTYRWDEKEKKLYLAGFLYEAIDGLDGTIRIAHADFISSDGTLDRTIMPRL